MESEDSSRGSRNLEAFLHILRLTKESFPAVGLWALLPDCVNVWAQSSPPTKQKEEDNLNKHAQQNLRTEGIRTRVNNYAHLERECEMSLISEGPEV